MNAKIPNLEKTFNQPAVYRATKYHAPDTPLFRALPVSWVPYAELMRLDRPNGWYAFWWHYMIGLAFAACVTPMPLAPAVLAGYTCYMAVWVLIFRGIVCTWNDNLDQEFDRRVVRTQFRPIARGAVSTTHGHVFTIAQLIVGTLMLIPLPPPVLVYSALMTAVLIVYPLCKRFTDFPQVVLGFGLAMPIFLCCSLAEVDLIDFWRPSGTAQMSRAAAGAVSLYLAGVLWTIIYDTVYAHQDIKDDRKAGVKSLAVRLGDYTKLTLGALGIVQVGCLAATGYFCKLSIAYYAISCGGTALALMAMLTLVDLGVPGECGWWFGQSKLVGLSVTAGLVSHYLNRIS